MTGSGQGHEQLLQFGLGHRFGAIGGFPNPAEVEAGTIPTAIAIPVGQLPARMGELDATRPTVVYCAGGYRSSVAASLLRQNGFVDVSDILGGYGTWHDAVQRA